MNATNASAAAGNTQPIREYNLGDLSLHHKIWRDGDVVVKRSLTTAEWVERHGIDPTISHALAGERVLNEAACLRYLRNNTQVPVPHVHACYEDRGEMYLVTHYVEGTRMDKLPLWHQLLVIEHLKQLFLTLDQITTDTFGGPGGQVLPPRRFLRAGCVYNNTKKYIEKSLVFCHGNLQPRHVIVNPYTLQILAITGWGYGGFFHKSYRGTPFDPTWVNLTTDLNAFSDQLWLEGYILDKDKSPPQPDLDSKEAQSTANNDADMDEDEEHEA